MTNRKIISLKKMIIIRNEIKKNGKIVVFITGCFDFLHLGHIHFLVESKNFGGILIVGLNSDVSVKSLKGQKRPIINQFERAEVLSSLSCVDYVVIFNEPTAINILKALRPDIYVDNNFRNHNTVEASVVTKYGGNLKTVSSLKGYSTTELIKRIVELYCRGD